VRIKLSLAEYDRNLGRDVLDAVTEDIARLSGEPIRILV
jgi:hypothetical protein